MKPLVTAAVVVAFLLSGSAFADEHPDHPKAKEKPAGTANIGSGALDGKVFVGVLGKTGETEGDKDELVFKNGTFVSTACVPQGFHDAPYTVMEKDGVVTFVASPTNASGEKMSWTGTIRDDALVGKAVHRTASGETTYWFKGKPGSAKDADHPKKSEHPEHPK